MLLKESFMLESNFFSSREEFYFSRELFLVSYCYYPHKNKRNIIFTTPKTHATPKHSFVSRKFYLKVKEAYMLFGHVPYLTISFIKYLGGFLSTVSETRGECRYEINEFNWALTYALSSKKKNLQLFKS